MARPKPICKRRVGRFAPAETDPGKASAKQNVSRTAHHNRHDGQVHDWPGHSDSVIPSPTLVAAWLTLDMLPAERIPRWAAFWLVDGYDGPALVELAGLHGDDPREVRDLLPAALVESRVAVPAADAAAAMEAFTHLAQLCVDGKAGERWIVDKVAEILSRSCYANEVIALPLGQLYDLDDEWGAGWGRTDAELRAVTRQACHDQLRLAAV
jgi:hypothetical protein